MYVEYEAIFNFFGKEVVNYVLGNIPTGGSKSLQHSSTPQLHPDHYRLKTSSAIGDPPRLLVSNLIWSACILP